MMVERSGLDLSPSVSQCSSPDRSPNASPPHAPVPIDLTELRSHFMLQPDNKPERPCGRYDITRHLSEPQSVAARKLGIPVSTLSKRWKEAVGERKWPFRQVRKIDGELKELLALSPSGDLEGLNGEARNMGLFLQKKREHLLEPVSIRL